MHFPTVAAMVKKERAAKGVSLRELAEGTGLSHQQILRVERGICSLESALLVLKALGVSRKERARVVVKETYQLAMAS